MAEPPAPPGVAPIFGPTVVPQIVVGSPSPPTEPTATADTYRSFPFHPDTAIDGWSTSTMTLRGTSVRGHLHRSHGIPRQDDFTMHHLPDGRAIITVADGVSQATQSHHGATSATRNAATWLARNLTADVADTDWSNLFQSASWALSMKAQNTFGLDQPDPLRAEQEFATTLVCAVIEPLRPGHLRAHVVNCGDSSTWLLSGGRFQELAGGKDGSPEGVASSEVTGLPRVPKHIEPIVIDINPGDVLLIGTDGVSEPLGDGQSAVGDLLRDVLLRPGPPSLIEFAHAVDFSRETFDDDRTLVALWPAHHPGHPPTAEAGATLRSDPTAPTGRWQPA
ncbi:MAG TPA: protein phosphatase 2C domain-containing protein [Mycobacterium sp.]|nr:protein phosphatase 2C domain-containing protein [Mycobacterium sp.]